MTRIFDGLLLRMGLTCDELRAVRGRQIAYAGLMGIACVSLGLVAAIATNIVA